MPDVAQYRNASEVAVKALNAVLVSEIVHAPPSASKGESYGLMLIAACDRADMDRLPYFSGSNVMLLSAANFL